MPLTTGTCSLLTRSGIDVVRNKIKVFAQKKVSLPPNRHKIIILDEADSMTPGAQQALRRTMEIYAPTTRFCFACNQSNKIIEPIQSRCAILRFGRVSDEEVLRRLLEICEAEKVQYSDEGLAAVVFTAEGDMRQAINNLQSTWTGLGFVSPDHVFQVCDQPHPLVVREILEHCHAGRVDEALDKLDDGLAARVGPARLYSRTSHALTAGHRLDAHAHARGCRDAPAAQWPHCAPQPNGTWPLLTQAMDPAHLSL